MRFDKFQAVTFDCYGTLIDWETGILIALGEVLGAESVWREGDSLIRSFARHEREVEAGPYISYREVLAEVTRRIARGMGVLCAGDERVLAESVKDWPAFEETPRALGELKKRFRLAVLSNVDDDMFNARGGSRDRLGVPLDDLVSAQQVQSYKPGRAHFTEGLRRLALRAEQVLHVAESRYHDVEPAKAMGFATVWVNRKKGTPGGASASGEAEAVPDLEVASLSELVGMMG